MLIDKKNQFQISKLSHFQINYLCTVYINKADLNELEFPALLAEIAPFAYSPKTKEKILELRPMKIDEAELSLKKTSE